MRVRDTCSRAVLSNVSINSFRVVCLLATAGRHDGFLISGEGLLATHVFQGAINRNARRTSNHIIHQILRDAGHVSE